ncbi:sugar phosphate isomerase/epimerase family protein [Arthrobacter rhombi]|uniref:sugar phosphate isomerase/epimerase family protein n=1 Tax=Arthrobacter rhombi TaxID=71253 RepID=UPI003FD2F2FC
MTPSVQLYTVRGHLAEDLPGTLEAMAGIGFTQVEPYAFVERAAEYAEHLSRLGLAAPTAHVKLIDADLDAVFAAAKQLGISTIIDPHIDESRWTSRESVAGIARELKCIAAKASEHGLAVGYHNHAFELVNRIDGTAALEVFAEEVGDAVVLEVDTYWAEVGGESAPALLGRLGDRVQALHVKDGPKTKNDKEQVAVGAGSMPIAEILAAAPQALRVIELDDFNGDVLQAVTDSYNFLAGTK